MKRIISLILIGLLFISTLCVVAYADNRDLTVYYAFGSSTAYAYHATSTCSTLSRSVVGSFSLETAVKRGYSACHVCHPPKPDFEFNSNVDRRNGIGTDSNALSVWIGLIIVLFILFKASSRRKVHTQSIQSDINLDAHALTSADESCQIMEPKKNETLPLIAPNMRLYFWDKKREAIGIMEVTRADEDSFDFRYLGKMYHNVPYSSAKGKIFLRPENVHRPK